MLKKYKEHIKESYDYEEEDYDEDVNLVIIGWREYDQVAEVNGSFFILEEIIDRETITLCNGFKHQINLIMGDDIEKWFTILSKKELENYIYSNKGSIGIWNPEKEEWDHYLWKFLPQNIKELL